MNIEKVMYGAVPVVVGIFVAGALLNALRDNGVVANVIKGYN